MPRPATGRTRPGARLCPLACALALGLTPSLAASAPARRSDDIPPVEIVAPEAPSSAVEPEPEVGPEPQPQPQVEPDSAAATRPAPSVEPEPNTAPPSEPEPPPPRTPALVTGGVALASLGVAVAFTVSAELHRRSLQRDLDNAVQYDDDDPRLLRGRRAAVLAGAMYGAAAIATALTVYYLLRGRVGRDRSRSQARIAPSVGPGGAGLIGSLRF